MSVLVIAEHEHGELKNITANVVSAARQLGGDIHLLVAGGEGSDTAARQAQKLSGVSQVLLSQSSEYQHQLAEDIAALVVSVAEHYDAVLAAATTTGKNLLPRVAALLDVQAVSDVTAIESNDTFKHPIYAGNVIATVQVLDAKKVFTVRPTAFDPVAREGDASLADLPALPSAKLAVFEKEELAKSDRPELTAASVVVSGGRGLQNGDNFELLYALADKLGAAVGASRAAVDAGFVPNDMQVGQTGKIVAPDLYIAVGISGAIQHLAGMKDSKVIVAINKDADAPIFQVADYGIVADLFDVLPELTEKL